MDTTNGHVNGKSSLIHVAHTPTIPAPPELHRPGMMPSNPRYTRVLDLVRDAVDLDMRLKATMNELDKEMRAVGSGDLPTVLVSLMKHHQQAVPQPLELGPARPAPTKPGVTKAKPRPRQKKQQQQAPVKNRGGKLKAQVMGLMADGKERKSIDIVKQLRAVNPTSVYSILSALASEGHLIRTKFAHYRLKMRKA